MNETRLFFLLGILVTLIFAAAVKYMDGAVGLAIKWMLAH